MTKHPQVTITHRHRTAEVDAGIAELILELWRADIDTMMSCQDNPDGRVWIDFPYSGAAENFLNIVASFDRDMESIYNRAGGGGFEPADWRRFRAERAWSYSASPHDYGAETIEPDEDDAVEVVETGPRDFTFEISVRFPQDDLAEVLARLRSYNVGSSVGRTEPQHRKS